MPSLRPRLALGAGLLLALCLAPVCPSHADGSPPPPVLRLKIGEFDPVTAVPELPSGLRYDAEPPSGVFVVQFDRGVTRGLLERVAATGAEPLEYLPEHAYLVRLREGAAGALRGLPEVRWLGVVQPGWKISPDLGTRPFQDPTRREGGLMDATVDLFPGGDATAVADQIRATGAEVTQTLHFAATTRIRVHGSREQLERTARIAGVSWIEEAGEITLRNNTTRWVIQTDVPSSTTVWDHGLHGEGQIIGHIDGPIDMSSCYFIDPVDNTPGPDHRKVIAYRSTTGLGADSHGTHTAGTAAGDQFPINGTLDYDGNAYAAKISHSNLSDITGSRVSPSNLYTYLAAAHADGARVHTNSWGDDGVTSYTTWCVDIDRFSYDYEDSLVVFAETNTSSLRTPENAKDVLAVGASRNGLSDDLHCSGGVGPTSDGRRKPEIYAPGCSIVSARNLSACSTRSLSGTSMASPAVTAAGALVRQYYEEGWYPTGMRNPADGLTPTGALVKATLLDSTTDMTGITGYPSDLEGWGRVLLENALYFDGDVRRLAVLDDVRNASGLGTGDVGVHPLTVDDTQEPLKITMVYTDPPASLLASLATVNDLDLEVTSPSGQVYLGNAIDPLTGLSVTGGSPDTRNNVEMVILDGPETGEWTVRVRGSAVNEGTQGYALVASGQVVPVSAGALRHQGHVVTDAPPLGNGDGIADPGETVDLSVTLANVGTSPASGITAALSSDLDAAFQITTDAAPFPSIPAGGTGTSLSPGYRFTVDPGAACGTRAHFQLATSSSQGEGATTFPLDVGKSEVVVAASGLPVSIAKKATLTSTLEVADAFTIQDVQAAVSVQHDDIGQLLVTLASPQGTTVTLHDHSRTGTVDLDTVYDAERQPDGPGTMSDFNLQPAQGTWTLTVTDDVAGPVGPGQLVAWSLELEATAAISCTPLSCADPVPPAVAPGMILSIENGADLRFDWPAVAGAAGYRVWSSTAAEFTERAIVGSSTGTTLVQAAGLDPEDRFYVVRAVNSCEWEGP